MVSNKTKNELNVGDFIKVKILSKTFNFNDNQIKTMGYLEDVANKEETDKYFSTITQDNELVLIEDENINEEESDDYDEESDEEDYNDQDYDDQEGGNNISSNFII